MISAETSALVEGGMRRPAAEVPPIRVRVVRAFMLAGKPQEVGSTVKVARDLAAELVAAGKAERLPAPASADAARGGQGKRSQIAGSGD